MTISQHWHSYESDCLHVFLSIDKFQYLWMFCFYRLIKKSLINLYRLMTLHNNTISIDKSKSKEPIEIYLLIKLKQQT